MAVRWRQHEQILINILGAILLAGYWWMFYHRDLQAIQQPFIDHHTPFSSFRNMILPDLGLGLVIYACYWLVANILIKRVIGNSSSLQGKKISLQTFVDPVRYCWIALAVLVVVFLIGTARVFNIYYKEEWLFNYSGFSFLPQRGYFPNPQIDATDVYWSVLAACGIFALYIIVRETIIFSIERNGPQKAYRALICNQVTTFLIVYITILFFAAVFRLIPTGEFILAYFSLVIPVFLVYLSNTYWLFPLVGEGSLYMRKNILRLLLSTLVCCIPFLLAPFHGVGYIFFGCWGILLFVVTPVTRLLYQQRKDKILQLRGVEKDLVRSKADLQFLRSQINPHFLFNVLNTLYGTALQEEADRTARGIQQLGDMMRFMLHENTLDFIALSQETEYLKNYIALQKLRIPPSGDITIEAVIDEKQGSHRIAPMLLIPFVENAFKHGIRLEKPSWIKIQLACTEHSISFEVRNSVHPPQEGDPEKEGFGIGHNNVLERIQLIYPGRHQVSITNDDKQFSVKLLIFS